MKTLSLLSTLLLLSSCSNVYTCPIAKLENVVYREDLNSYMASYSDGSVLFREKPNYFILEFCSNQDRFIKNNQTRNNE